MTFHKLSTRMKIYPLVIFFITALPWASHATNIQKKWQSFFQRTWQIAPLVVNSQELSHFPQKLLRESARYPDFEYYSWGDIQILYQIAQDCQVNKPTQPHLKTAVEFELALCHNQSLDETWFSTHSPIHPAGGSFAERYLSKHPEKKTTGDFLRYLTISNPKHPLNKQLSLLSVKGRETLLNGYRAWMEEETLWLSGEQGWKAVPNIKWHPVAKELNIRLSGPNCELRYSNLCINEVTHNLIMQRLILISISVIVLFLFAKSLYIRRKQNREKRFILQLLTHELRTPITSLGLTVEMLRNQFDLLTEETQQAVWRLISDHQRLAQLTENSKVYLSTHSSHQLMEQTAYISDWLDHLCEKHNLSYQLNQDKEVTLPFYWLSICMDNLIRNAKQHGKGEVTVYVTLTDKLKLTVSDQGVFPSTLSQLMTASIAKPSTDNMGMGLSIIRHLIALIGGHLTIRRRPTRCTLEIPL